MADEAPASPPGESPFRGGFRFHEEDGRVVVDVWGSDLSEVLPRAAESVSRVAGVPVSIVQAPPFRLEAHAATAAELVVSLTTTLVGMLHDEGRYVRAAVCRSVIAVEEGGSLPPGVACVLVLEGGHVDGAHDPGLRRLHPPRDGAGMWEEDGIVRTRFHLTVE